MTAHSFAGQHAKPLWLAMIGLLGAAVAGGAIFALLALGFDPIFSQGVGYGAGYLACLAAFTGLMKRSRKQRTRTTIDPDGPLRRIDCAPSTEFASGCCSPTPSEIASHQPVGPDGDGAQATNRQLALFSFACALAYWASLAALIAMGEKLDASTLVAQLAAGALFLLVVSLCLVFIPKILLAIDALKRANSRTFRPTARRTILAAAVAALLVVDALALHVVWNTIDVRTDTTSIGRVAAWIMSAHCFKKTGVILAVCEQPGRFDPIENASAADDRGHGLLLSILHGEFGVPATTNSLLYLNIGINVVGFALLAWQLYRTGAGVGAVIFFLMSLRLLRDPVVISDVPGASFGMFALSLLLPIQALRMFALDQPAWREWLWLALSGLCLVWIMLTRESSGLIAIAVTALSLVFGFAYRARKLRVPHFASAAAAVATILVALNAASLLVNYRIHVQGVPAGSGILSHGLSHALYLGLGAEPNSFGIEWSDANAGNAVQARDPTIEFASPQYYEMLSKLYLDLVRQHPLEVARIYAAKARKVLAPTVIVALVLSAAAIYFGLAVQPARAPPISYRPSAAELVAVTVAAVLLHTMQAILTIPAAIYYKQAYVGLALLVAIAADIWFKAAFEDQDAGERQALSKR